MSTICYLYNYNKYFNRRFKREANLSAYQDLATAANSKVRVRTQENTNFDISDGVSAKHVFNVGKTEDDFFKYSEPDYCVVLDPLGNLTRWYILECIKIRGNQFQVSLRRDLIADYFDKVKDIPFFVEKGRCDIDDPAIFNNEGMGFNQIKQSEILLKDDSKSAWVVGYFANNEEQTEDKNIVFETEVQTIPVIEYDSMSNRLQYIFDHYNTLKLRQGYKLRYTQTRNRFLTSKFFKYQYILHRWYINFGVGYSARRYGTTTDEEVDDKLSGLLYRNAFTTFNDSYALSNSDWNNLDEEYQNVFQNRVGADYDNYIDEDELEGFERGFYVRKNGVVYYIKLSKGNEITSRPVAQAFTINNYQSSNLGIVARTLIEKIATNKPDTYTYNGNNSSFNKNQNCFWVESENYEVEFERYIYPSFKGKVTIHREHRNLLDAPYGMFAIPLSSVNVILDSNNDFNTLNGLALSVARSMAISFGKEGIYDIQLLPYCPYQYLIDSEGVLDLSTLTEGVDYDLIQKNTSSSDNIGIILYPDKSSGSFDIELDLESHPELDIANSVIDKKVKSETDLIRFVSPNYASMYEVNAQKNDGISVVNVDYDYRPYNPYIHVSPIFKAFYGQDFNDPKGLILSGDFSITVTSNLWQEYQIQNKNYQLIFDRQIQNLDVNNSIAMEKEKITAITGAITNAASMAIGGGIAGAAIGGAAGTAAGAGYGTVIGGAIGAVGGAIGGAGLSVYGAMKDIELLAKQQSENRDYAIDMYTYQLGNIKAMPNTLTKVTAYNNNNKLFPTIEYYTCTDEEKDAFRNKLLYNGMTIMRIGTLRDFVLKDSDEDLSYFQGQMIITNPANELNEANHEIVELYNEFKKGVYF